MKSYEIYSKIKTIPDIPIIIRLDGRSFSNYTKKLKLKKPFDDRLRDIFIEVSKDIMKEFNPEYIYTFSDEINIQFNQIPFNRRIEKIDSILASYTAASFMKHLCLNISKFNLNIADLKVPSFDSRIIIKPNNIKEYFKWRQDEAWRNCLNGYAQATLNKKHDSKTTAEILYKLNKKEIHDLLFNNGLNIAKVPTWQKRGIAIYKKEEKTNIKHNNTTKPQKAYKKIYVDMEIELLK